ncbi:hypothetical protein GCM10009682_20690 [Luedemannella flava]|uniref:Uncharacterized protein n=1 Tax=Luedemannella flava TaxID=349316 RepID=A0ABP4Y2D8_9ACTN
MTRKTITVNAALQFIVADSAAVLDRRHWIPKDVVTRLIEYGHVDVVRRLAGEGEWTCVVAMARLLCDEGQGDAAVGLLRPFADTGWWTATKTLSP